MENNFILCPEGWAVNINYAVSISTVTYSKHNGVVSFYIIMANGNSEYFKYWCANYAETPEELVDKVNNIRHIILRKVNGGNDPVEINAPINLKKNTTEQS